MSLSINIQNLANICLFTPRHDETLGDSDIA